MKLNNITEVKDFLTTLNNCEGCVWLESKEGDCINLKSSLSCYVALGKLLSEHGSDLELFCSNPNDEQKFYQFFEEYQFTPTA